MSKKESLDDDVDLLLYARIVWKHKVKLTIYMLLFGILGVLVALSSKNKYTADTTFIPESSASLEGIAGQFGGIASIAGIDLGGSKEGDEFPPALYPKLMDDVKFQMSLLEAKLILPSLDSLVTYKSYYEEVYKPSSLEYMRRFTIGLPNIIISALRKNVDKKEKLIDKNGLEIPKLSADDMVHIDRLNKQVLIDPNVEEGFVRLAVTMPDSYLAAQITKNLKDLIIERIVSYKIQKAKNELEYTQRVFEEKKALYEDVQIRLALFKDRNRNIETSVGESRLIALQDEYDLAYTIYKQLATQLEEAKLKLTKDTPQIIIIDDISIPSRKSGPNKFIILFAFISLGLVIGCLNVFEVKTWALNLLSN